MGYTVRGEVRDLLADGATENAKRQTRGDAGSG